MPLQVVGDLLTFSKVHCCLRNSINPKHEALNLNRVTIPRILLRRVPAALTLADIGPLKNR